MEWLYQYPWLAYSKKLKGALCVHCVLFFRPNIKRGVQGAFISRAFIKYKDLHDSAKKHSQTEWHKETIMKSKLFSDVTNKKKSVDLQLNDANNELVMKNRDKLRSIISSIIFLWHSRSSTARKTIRLRKFPRSIKIQS